MKQQLNSMVQPPSASAYIAVNKSRLKIYNKEEKIPTYYLKKGQEFQFELFNPTSDTLLAKITLNGKIISQGGLVLNPGQRVFLERYLDDAKKFLFDTYEVESTDEVKKAIQDNGDIKIEFFKERFVKIPIISNFDWTFTSNGRFGDDLYRNIGSYYTNSKGLENNISSYYNNTNDLNLSEPKDIIKKSDSGKKRFKKTMETGRIEKGSDSNQTFKHVNKTFEFWPINTIEYKLLPVSEKINSSDDIKIKVYCTQCGAKLGKTDKFCSQCGHKA